MILINQEVAFFTQELQQTADPVRAVNEKKYLKHDMSHFGVRVPVIRRLASDWIKNHKDCSTEELIGLACALWDQPYHETRMLTVFLLRARVKDLMPHHLLMLEGMLRTGTSWAQIDGLAVWVVGPLMAAHPELLQHLRVWIGNKNFWVRRAALIAQLQEFGAGRGDTRLFEELMDNQCTESKSWSASEKFFIRKAIGWALRTLSQADPECVFEIVRRHRECMSALSFREATRKLPAVMKAKLAI